MEPAQLRALLEALEGADTDVRPALALVGGASIELDEGELNGARRRALLLLAAGGDPLQGLDLDGRAVKALAAELDAPQRRAQLVRSLEELLPPAAGLPLVADALESLVADAGLAWRAFACALLADELDV